jgi:hypothetical protein
VEDLTEVEETLSYALTSDYTLDHSIRKTLSRTLKVLAHTPQLISSPAPTSTSSVSEREGEGGNVPVLEHLGRCFDEIAGDGCSVEVRKLSLGAQSMESVSHLMEERHDVSVLSTRSSGRGKRESGEDVPS